MSALITLLLLAAPFIVLMGVIAFLIVALGNRTRRPPS
jgi:hypothetical protein